MFDWSPSENSMRSAFKVSKLENFLTAAFKLFHIDIHQVYIVSLCSHWVYFKVIYVVLGLTFFIGFNSILDAGTFLLMDWIGRSINLGIYFKNWQHRHDICQNVYATNILGPKVYAKNCVSRDNSKCGTKVRKCFKWPNLRHFA